MCLNLLLIVLHDRVSHFGCRFLGQEKEAMGNQQTTSVPSEHLDPDQQDQLLLYGEPILSPSMASFRRKVGRPSLKKPWSRRSKSDDSLPSPTMRRYLHDDDSTTSPSSGEDAILSPNHSGASTINISMSTGEENPASEALSARTSIPSPSTSTLLASPRPHNHSEDKQISPSPPSKPTNSSPVVSCHPKSNAGSASPGHGTKMVSYRLHPQYSKYFKMLRMGLAIDQVKHALVRDGLDPSIADRDPDELVKSDQTSTSSDNNIPAAQVLPGEGTAVPSAAMLSAALSATTLGLSRMSPPISDTSKAGAATGKMVPYKLHPEYSKYFKMLRMGLGVEQVKHALARDGLDASIADRDPDELVKAPSTGNGDTGRASGASTSKPVSSLTAEIKKGPKRRRLFWYVYD